MNARFFPAIEWLRHYQRRDLKHDLSAGLTVAIMLVPQGMAYAMLAGLPPVIGLYSSTLPLLAYAFLGTSRQLAVGPVAMVSLLVYVGASNLASPGSPDYVSLVLLLTLMTGLIQFMFGVLRMGFIVNFLSHAVISGFTSAAAIVIGLSQLKHLLGVKLSGQHSVFQLLYEAAQKIHQANILTVFIGLISIGVLVYFKKNNPKFPAPLVVVAVSTLVVYGFHLERYGVSIVGSVPSGIPKPSFPAFNAELIQTLFPVSITIVFVGFMESIAVAQSIAAKERYKVNANQEFIGLGVANIVSSLFSGYPVTGGFSRTAVNYQAGAKTGLASMITAVLVILTLLFLTPVFYYLPNAVLAAIIMVAVYGLIDIEEARHLLKLKKIDGWTLLLTFVCTLVLGIEQGILIGVVFSLMVFIWRSAHPHTAELGYIKAQDVFLNVDRFPEAKTFPHTLILRIDASMFFANMRFIENRLRGCLVDKSDVTYVVFDLSGVNDIDAVAISGLRDLIYEYREQGIQFAFSGMKGPVRDLFIRAECQKACGHKVEYQTLHHVLQELGKFDSVR
jgi:SulP family sulfate permease